MGEESVLAEPVHGSAPDIAGKGLANPVATIRAAALLLAQLGLGETAARIERAVATVLGQGIGTPDLGGTAATADVTAAVCEALVAQPA